MYICQIMSCFLQAPLDLLCDVCVQVDDASEFNHLNRLLHTLAPAENRRFFGAYLNRNVENDHLVASMQRLMLLLSEKAPALDTLCMVLNMNVTREVVNTLITGIHTNVAALCVQVFGLKRYACCLCLRPFLTK